MIHFALNSDGSSPITDDQGESGIPVFGGVIFDGTPGAGGSIKDIALFVFNDDNNFKYNEPEITITSTDLVAMPSWFLMLDDSLISGISPTEAEWSLYGIPGSGTLVLADISNLGGANPNRKMWLRAMVPDGTATANLSGVRIKASAVQEAV
jgi:hypothetical protein